MLYDFRTFVVYGICTWASFIGQTGLPSAADQSYNLVGTCDIAFILISDRFAAD